MTVPIDNYGRPYVYTCPHCRGTMWLGVLHCFYCQKGKVSTKQPPEPCHHEYADDGPPVRSMRPFRCTKCGHTIEVDSSD